jgi:hypothetical protein
VASLGLISPPSQNVFSYESCLRDESRHEQFVEDQCHHAQFI